MPYRFVEHPADIAFDAWAEELSGLFTAAADALLHCMVDNPDSVRPEIVLPVELRSPELDLMLLALLQEPIYFKDAQGLLLRVRNLRVEQLRGGWRVEGELAGEGMDPARHRLEADVKAVTLYQLKVEQVPEGWQCHVVLDV